MASATNEALLDHLLRHYRLGADQEELCFALWRPSAGRSRFSGLLLESILPGEGDRNLHENASFNAAYFARVIARALEAEAGIAFLHGHPGPGWQGMSPDDVMAEQRMAPRVFGATGLPLLGMTVGTDGAWSARFWNRVDRSTYLRQWCGSVRTVGEAMRATFNAASAPPPAFRQELARTVSAWGEEKQRDLARLRIGIVGVGSVGALVSEALARQGVEDILLIDFDRVERHNLDRLVHATARDIGRLKVDVAADRLRENGTAKNLSVEALPLSVVDEAGYRAALDCDVLFSCVDRPWPRAVLNLIANAHLIPVIDGGLLVTRTPKGHLRGAHWRAHVAAPGRPCLECLGQFDPADVSLERTGLLDQPSYVEGLPADHFARRNENVFAFSMNAAGLQMLQFLSMVVTPGGVADPGALIYHFSNARMDQDERSAGCMPNCRYPSLLGTGDRSGVVATRQQDR